MSTHDERLDRVTHMLINLAERSPILGEALADWEAKKYTWIETMTFCVFRQAKEIERLQNYIDKECK